jgi:hypothetical protein
MIDQIQISSFYHFISNDPQKVRDFNKDLAIHTYTFTIIVLITLLTKVYVGFARMVLGNIYRSRNPSTLLTKVLSKLV